MATPSSAAQLPAVTAFADPRDPRWCRFVEAHPDALPFHRPAWLETLSEAYGFRPFILALVGADGAVGGGIPLMEMRDPVRGARWTSLPFTDRCPPLLAPADTERVLADGLREFAADAGVSRVEVRAPLPGWAPSTVATVHELDLSPGPDAVRRGFASAARGKIRKAERQAVLVRVAGHEEELTQTFYHLHLRTRRRLGVPVQPRRFFRSLWHRVLEPGHGQLLLAFAGGVPVAGAVFLRAGDTVVYKYSASDERAWRLCPNNLLLWEAIRRGADDGYARFDFGRTDFADAGLRAFKKGWGALERPLVYSTPEGRGASTGLSGGRLLAGIIRRSPTGVCRAIGESLYRYAA